MTQEPRVNLHRLAANIVLDATLLRWFAYNGRRDEVMAAIMLQRSRAKDTEDQVLDFLVRHCGAACNERQAGPAELNDGKCASFMTAVQVVAGCGGRPHPLVPVLQWYLNRRPPPITVKR
jgi:hypothetical protein